MSDKSKSEITHMWKKKNPDKVKEYAKTYNKKYYQRTRQKRSLEFKINYHRYAIRNCIPATYFEDVDDKLQHITVDHDYFDDKLRPKILWNTITSNTLSLEEIQNNINYVLRLQKKNIIPKFLFNHAETCILYDKLNSLKYIHLRGMISVKIGSEEWDKRSKVLDKEWDELYDNLLDENYDSHIAKANN